MTTKNRSKVPVDDAGLDTVSDADWASDDGPDQYFEMIAADPKAKAAFDSVLEEIRDHQATLMQVRKAQNLTQTTIGALLDMDQSEVSRLERRSDMLLSTLRAFIRASGGELQLVATYPDANPVQLLIGEDDNA